MGRKKQKSNDGCLSFLVTNLIVIIVMVIIYKIMVSYLTTHLGYGCEVICFLVVFVLGINISSFLAGPSKTTKADLQKQEKREARDRASRLKQAQKDLEEIERKRLALRQMPYSKARDDALRQLGEEEFMVRWRISNSQPLDLHK